MGFVLMLGGVALFSRVTANLASLLVRGEKPQDKVLSQLVTEVESFRREVAQLHSGQSCNIKYGDI